MVVSVHGAVQALAHFHEVFSEHPQATVQVSAQGRDLLGVFCQPLLTPAEGHRPQQGDQRGGCGQHHALVDTELDERGIPFERRREERLAGQEQHHELRRAFLELVPVSFSAQGGEVGADRPGVFVEAADAGRFIGGLQRGEIGREGRLGVYGQAFAAGQAHHQIRPADALVGAELFLLGEVAVGEHARHFDNALELDLAPASAHGRALERGGEAARLARELGVGCAQGGDLFDQRGLACAPLTLKFGHRGAEPVEALAYGLHQGVHGLGAGVQFALGLLLEAPECRGGEV